MPISTLTATIPAGESISEAVDCSAGSIVRIYFPDAWTGPGMTFEVSPDGQDPFYPVYELDGKEASLPVIEKGSVLVPSYVGRGLAFVKFRAGTLGAPVEQPEDRVIQITILK